MRAKLEQRKTALKQEQGKKVFRIDGEVQEKSTKPPKNEIELDGIENEIIAPAQILNEKKKKKKHKK
jgi:hypothetical protein